MQRFKSEVRSQIAEVQTLERICQRPLHRSLPETQGPSTPLRSGRNDRARVTLRFSQNLFIKPDLRPDHAFGAIGFGAGVGDVIALAVEADDEHGTAVAVASRLVGSEDGRGATVRCRVADALPETAMTEFVGTAEEFDGVVSTVGSESGLHGAVMLVAKGKDIRPHRQRV